MSYELDIQRSLPSVFTPLSGINPPLAAGSGTSVLRTTATTVAWNAWTQLRENSPFTVELWYLPVTVTGETIVVGHLTEGVIFNGTDLILRIKYSNGTTLESRWTPTQIQSWHIALVYDGYHYNVYVNGDIVISLDALAGVTWTETQTAVSLNRVLTGSGSGIYDAIAMYYRSLTDNEVKVHYAMGKATVDSQTISTSYGANAFELVYKSVDIYDSVVFDLSSGIMSNVGYGTKVTAYDATGGTWITSIPLASLAGTKTAGVHLTYVGVGVTLAYSTNGTTWTTTANKRTILEDTTPPDTLQLRLTLANDKAWVSDFRADILNTRTMQPVNGPRTLAFKGTAMDQASATQLDYQYDQGAQISSGYLDIKADPNTTPANVAAIEAWMRFDAAAGWVIDISGTQFVSIATSLINGTGITIYRNGALLAANASSLTGQWNHYVFVLSTPVNSVLRIGDKLAGGSALKLSAGTLALYTTAPSAARIQSIYNANIGAPVARIDDVGVIGVSEKSPAVDIYGYSWSIVSNGV